jgi:SAM-dependent methyltransferase
MKRLFGRTPRAPQATPPDKPQGPPGVRALGHRAYVGGLWEEMGRLQFTFLVGQGLRPHHVVLDLGCGSLRAGVHLIAYLEPGHYLGLDKEEALIEAGLAHELDPAVRAAKRPRFHVSDRFEVEAFGVRPDFALAQSVFTHLPGRLIRECMTRLRGIMGPTGVFYATFFEVATPAANPEEPHDHGYFAYTREEMEDFGRDTGWRAEYIGPWDHPRDQRMVRYVPA